MRWFIITVVALMAVWLIWPSKVDPAVWLEPDPPALTGPLEPRGRLATAELIAPDGLLNSEDLALGPDGSVFASQIDGTLAELRRVDGNWQIVQSYPIAQAPALGLQWHPDGRLIVAASDGVYALDTASGAVASLTRTAAGRPLGFADDLDIADDGTIYFTEASWKWANRLDQPSYHYDMAENRPYGALVALDPRTGETRILADDLYFANGVAMASDQRSVFFIETYRYRLSRYWLAGPRAGEVDIVADNLPGIPDGVTADGNGRLLIAMDTQRVPLMRLLHEQPFLTRMLTKLPDWVWLRGGRPKGFVLVVDESGTFIDSYHDPDGRFGYIANVVPGENGEMWIGSLTAPVIGRFEAP
ncbi:SMP-30/gluconolactonase/LRE family protein [Maricaulis sp. CAU 1757]